MKSLAFTLLAVGALICSGIQIAAAAGPTPQEQIADLSVASTAPSGLWFFYQDPSRFVDGAAFGGGGGGF